MKEEIRLEAFRPRTASTYETLVHSLDNMRDWYTSSDHFEPNLAYRGLFTGYARKSDIGEGWMQLLNALAVDARLEAPVAERLTDEHARMLGFVISENMTEAFPRTV